MPPIRGSEIETAANEIAIGNSDLSQRTEQTTSHLQRANISMELLAASVKESARAAADSNRLAAGAATVAEKGGLMVREVVLKMNDITQPSRKLREIIGVIKGIASHTCILALNAAAAAAREFNTLIGASVTNVEAELVSAKVTIEATVTC
jgi:methyl-accepting chemotaxis protein